jgi:hypothetical protein
MGSGELIATSVPKGVRHDPLRQRMIKDMQIRNFTEQTQSSIATRLDRARSALERAQRERRSVSGSRSALSIVFLPWRSADPFNMQNVTSDGPRG